jgi:hypothetical protein
MSMKTFVAIPVPTDEFLALVNFLREEGSSRDPVETVSHAIDYWIKNARKNPNNLSSGKIDTLGRGFTWKHKDNQIFLPHDTEIRMRYKHRYHYAKVEGDEIIYEGKSLSPARLARTITNSSRNAWHDLWIKHPGWKTWKLADEWRRTKQANVAPKALGL